MDLFTSNPLMALFVDALTRSYAGFMQGAFMAFGYFAIKRLLKK